MIKAGEGEQGEETVTSWNVELEPVRRIKLDGVEVGKEIEGKVGDVKEESESGAVVEEGEEGDVASFEKVESSASTVITRAFFSFRSVVCFFFQTLDRVRF